MSDKNFPQLLMMNQTHSWFGYACVRSHCQNKDRTTANHPKSNQRQMPCTQHPFTHLHPLFPHCLPPSTRQKRHPRTRRARILELRRTDRLQRHAWWPMVHPRVEETSTASDSVKQERTVLYFSVFFSVCSLGCVSF